jgi:branched-chain amino acid transport system ATP-binding protein
MSQLALQARDLRKAFGALLVTDDLSLALAPGARHALIGPNGAGKTTLVNLLSGVLTPDSGAISIFGQDVTSEGPVRRTKRGLVRTFQISSLFPKLSVLENVFLAVSEHAGASFDLWRSAGHKRSLIERSETVIASKIDRRDSPSRLGNRLWQAAAGGDCDRARLGAESSPAR